MSGINDFEAEPEFNHASDLFPFDILCFVTSGNLAYRHDADFVQFVEITNVYHRIRVSIDWRGHLIFSYYGIIYLSV